MNKQMNTQILNNWLRGVWVIGMLVALVIQPAIQPASAHSKNSSNKNYSREQVMTMVVNEAVKQNFPPELALAVAKVESNFNHKALSHAGARGVMQMMPKTAWDLYGVSARKLYNPHVNIHYGIKYLKHLIKTYDDYVDIALSHYNGGSRVRGRHGVLRVIPATRNYVQKVMDLRIDYKIHPKVMLASNRLSPKAPMKANYSYVRHTADSSYLQGLDDFSAADKRIKRLLAKRKAERSYQPPTEREKLVAKLRKLKRHNKSRTVAEAVDTRLPAELETKAEKKALVASWEAY